MLFKYIPNFPNTFLTYQFFTRWIEKYVSPLSGAEDENYNSTYRFFTIILSQYTAHDKIHLKRGYDAFCRYLTHWASFMIVYFFL